MLRLLYSIAREAEGVTHYSDGIRRGRGHVFSNWEWWARTAAWPLMLQVLCLWMLYEILREKFLDAQEEMSCQSAASSIDDRYDRSPTTVGWVAAVDD